MKKPRLLKTQKDQLKIIEDLQRRIREATYGNDSVNTEVLKSLVDKVKIDVMDQRLGVEDDIRKIGKALVLYEQYHNTVARRKAVLERAKALEKHLALVHDSRLDAVAHQLKNLIIYLETMTPAVAEETISSLEYLVGKYQDSGIVFQKETPNTAPSGAKPSDASPRETIQEISDLDKMISFVTKKAREAQVIHIKSSDRHDTPLYLSGGQKPAFYRVDEVVYNVTLVIKPRLMTAEEYEAEGKAP